MKKLLFLFMIFCFLGVFTVTAAPVEEKQVMVFVLDVGAVTTARVMEVTTLDTNMAKKILYEPMVSFNKGIPGILTVYYGSKKIRYDTFLNNDNANLKRTVNAIKIGDTVPIAA